MPWIDPYADLRPDPLAGVAGPPAARDGSAPPTPAGTVLVGGRVHRLASIDARIAAALLDLLAYRIVLYGLAIFWALLMRLHDARGDGFDGIPAPVLVAYYGFTIYFFGVATCRAGGQSVGKRLMGLRVVRTDGSVAGPERYLVRETLFRALPLAVLPLRTLPGPIDAIFVAGGVAALLLASREPQRQAFWDRLAGTVVIEHDPVPLKAPPPAGAGPAPDTAP